MEKTQTNSTIQTAAKEAAESARKVGASLRTLASSTAESSGRWAKRCGEAISDGARFAALEAKQTRVRKSLGRAHEELGRAVYALHGKAGGASFAEAPELEGALHQVREAEAIWESNRAKLAELRQTLSRGDSTSS